jgi:hypothetical protein
MGTMEEFTVRTAEGTLQVTVEEVYGFPDRTSHFGGYDVRGVVTIHLGPYHVDQGCLWFSTGEVWQFYTDLQKAYDDLTGSARFCSSDGQLQFALRLIRGGGTLEGKYQEKVIPEAEATRLYFVARNDQTYLVDTLRELSAFVGTYGDLRGLHR